MIPVLLLWTLSHIDYENNLTQILKNINGLFKAKFLTLYLDKTYFMQFLAKNGNIMNMLIIYGNSQIATSTDIKFLGLIIDNTVSWNGHIDWFTSKLGSDSYAVRAIKLHVSLEIIRMMYFSYFHSVITYDLIFWSNPPLSIHIFRLQKRAIRIIINSRIRETRVGSCLRN
jgi:hypothetical protein